MISINISIAQKVQYASKVLEYSSEYTSKKYSAQQILGRPSTLPAGTFYGNTWAAAGTAVDAFIKVGFAEPMEIEQVIIFEFHRANSISEVIAFDESGNSHSIYQNKPKDIGINKRTLSIKIERTSYKVTAIKLLLDFRNFNNLQAHIDAIAISDSQAPITNIINTPDNSAIKNKPQRLSENVNSTCGELVPILSSDGKSLIFLRDNCSTNMAGAQPKNCDIYISQKTNNEWSLAENIGKPISNKGNNAAFAVSPDGNNILIKGSYKKNGQFDPMGGLSLSHKTKDGWSEPELMDIKNYYTQTDVINFFLADDWKTLILAIQRDDSYGAADLYVSFRTNENSWTEPKHMGPVINSTNTDFSPYLAPDGKTLYFASYTLPGYGSADMFMSKRLDDSWENWSEPINLGPEINSSGFDAYYRITTDGNKAYYVSSNGSNSSDIYMVDLPESIKPEPVVLITGKVINSKTNEPISANIYYENLSSNKEMGQTSSSPDNGYYSIVLPFGNQVGFRASSNGYISSNENLDLTEFQNFQTIERDIFLTPIEIGQVVKLNNIFFETGKSSLLIESYPELDRLVQLMKENPKMKIELLGHTDNVGSDQSNLNLSNERVTSVKNYLIKNGIDETRIIGKGYGSASPIAPNDNDENRQLNRRVELKVLSI